ncbi:MAG: adenylate/guanylate cyclase domain-containing protein [Actinomycetota bacterium]
MTNAADGLFSFVPRLAVELARESGNRYEQVEGSMLSADISGFTALSEKLAGKGKAGAEEITDLINTCFAALIGEAYAENGEILKFGGDAILVLFRGDEHARRCAAAALAMQHSLHALSAAKKARLTMTVGAHTGVFDTFLVGSAHRELLITGADATRVIELEGNAEKGETLVSAEMLAAVPGLESIAEYGTGHRVDGLLGSTATGPTERRDFDFAASELADLIPDAVSSQLGGVLNLGGEHRQLGICFVLIGGITESIETIGGERTAELLADLVDHVLAASGSFGTAFLHSDIADHGAKFVLTAGAPTAHGNNAEAVLRAALQIAQAPSPFVVRIGVQVGRGFAGFLGTPSRRTYTVMGDPVNTAARMLGKAGDRDVIAMDDVVRATDTLFLAEELEPFLVKGKTDPVTAHLVVAATDETRRDLRHLDLVGRGDEIAAIDGAFDLGGSIVEIDGPPGSGKSRLVDEVLLRSHRPVLRGLCTRYGSGSPYAAMRPMLRSALGIDLYADAKTAGDVLTKVVGAEREDLLPLVPLLALPFGAEVEATTEADAIEPEYRRQVLGRTMIEFLEVVVPVDSVLVFEDLQWIDEASAALLTTIAEHVTRSDWLLVTTRRDDAGWRPDGLEPVVPLTLDPLTDTDIRRLIIDASSRSLPDAQIRTITEQAGGNPLFAVELSRAIAENASTEMPDSVEALLANRIDQLDPASRLYVRIVAVLGLDVSLAEIDAVVEAEAPGLLPDLPSIRHVLEPRGDQRLGFTNTLYRDAAYEGLPYKRRRRLHRVAAEVLDVSFAEESSALASASLLAFHYSESGDHLEAWSYGVLAGDLARMQWANQNAAAAYERALEAGSHIRQVDTDVIVRVLEALADCRLVNGDFDGANEAIDRARKRNHDMAIDIDLMRKRAVIAERQGERATAERWFRRARRLVPGGTFDHDLIRSSSTLHVEHAGLFHRIGDHERCIEFAQQALAEAEEIGDQRAEAKALQRLHLAITFLRRPDDHGWGRRALAHFRELDDHDQIAVVLNNLGVQAYFAGNWNDAIAYYTESAEERGKAGNTIELALAALNTGELLSDQGHWDRAAEMLTDAIRNTEAAGYAAAIGASKMFAGVNERRRENWDVARALLTDAKASFVELGLAELEEEASSRLLELDVFRGDGDREALATLLAAWGHEHHLATRLRWLLGVMDATEGDVDAAVAVFEDEIERSSGIAQARTADGLLSLRPDHPERERYQALVDEQYATAGVVQMALLPFER